MELHKRQFFLGAWLLAAAACGGGTSPTDAGPDGDGASGERDTLCSDISQCPSHHLCLEGLCRPGTSCTSSAQCPAGFECLILKEVCVPENPCTEDNQCSGATPWCLTSSGICVACRENAHCPTGQRCVDFGCTPEGPDCSSDQDCAGNPSASHCDTAQGKCFACVGDIHCGTQHCEPALHQCVACYQPSHCATPTPYCLTEQHLCVACRDNNDCNGGLRCSQAHECTAITCQNDNDCAGQVSTPHCNPQSGDCVQCTQDTHCGTFEWCRDFACRTGCLTDQECVEKQGAGYRCNATSGQCYYTECLANEDCSGVAGKPYCHTNADPQYNKCVACTTDAHCAQYYYCDAQNNCSPTPCYRYADPAATCRQVNTCYICDYGSGQCVPPTNQAGFSCTYPDGPECCPGYRCNASSKCEFDINCNAQDPVCAEGYTCNTSYNQCEWVSCCPACPAGKFCNSQSCQCEVGLCHQAGEECDPFKQNCCAPLRCSMFWPFCSGG